jgi:hypothetical protein
MSLHRRVEKLEQAQGGDAVEVDRVMVYTGGEVLELTPEEWRAYDEAHPGREYITIREILEDDTTKTT